MDFMVRDRRQGKTSYLIRRFMDDPKNSVILCHSESEAGRLRRLVKQNYGVDASANILSISQGNRLKGTRRKIYIDNVEALLISMFGDVDLVTATGDIL